MNIKSMLIYGLRQWQVKAAIRRVAETRSQLERFNEIWADAQENVPFYAEWAEKHHLPRQISDLSELAAWPILHKRDLMQNREKLTRKGVTRFHESVTGGSTGEPLHFRTMGGESDEVAVSKWIGWARLGLYPDSRCFLLWGHRNFHGQGFMSNIHFAVRRFKDWLTNNSRADATNLSLEALTKVYAKMRRMNPDGIIAYAASLLALVRAVRKDHAGAAAPLSALKAVVSDIALPKIGENSAVFIAGASAVQEIGKIPLLIGERLNPTGKAKLKAALRGKDWGYLQREALSQAERGVHALDVNVGLPGIDERATLVQAVRAVSSVCNLPLQLDTANAEAMEAALRVYCGRALINSVSGKEAVMSAVFPIAKKYGGVLIALTLDDEGIPATAEGRLQVAEKILETAKSYGFPPENIIFDPLAMAVSAAPDAASVALDAIRLIRGKLGNYTSLGVSNISFGLPQRDNINAAFFTLALEAGLSAAILNPGSEAMRRAYDSFLALKGLDAQCLAYISKYAEQADAPKTAAVTERPAALTLGECIRKGLVSDAEKTAAKALSEGQKPMDLVEKELIPALDAVGKGFEKGSVFLPQLILSADAAKAAFGALEQALPAGDSASGGTIVVATVKGDIHDIGKNIAAGILRNYRYEVIDLGKDVEPEKVVEAVREHNCRLCGLSALMTTTVGAMEETIRLLKAKAPECRVMVGGAVITEDYAKRIGADYYCESAMSDVRIAAEVFGE